MNTQTKTLNSLNFRYLSALLLICFFFIYIIYTVNNSPILISLEKNEIPSYQNVTENFIHHAVFTSFVNGYPKYRINSEEVLYYNHQLGAQLLKPHIVIYSTIGNKSWKINSLTGIVDTLNDKVTLEKSVSIVSIANESNNNPISLFTEKIAIWPKLEYGETELYVKINHQQNIATALGLKVNFKEKEYLLKHQVKMNFINKKLEN